MSDTEVAQLQAELAQESARLAQEYDKADTFFDTVIAEANLGLRAVRACRAKERKEGIIVEKVLAIFCAVIVQRTPTKEGS